MVGDAPIRLPQTAKTFRREKGILDSLTQKLKFKRLEDLYQLRPIDLRLNGGSTSLQKHGSLFRFICSVYPTHDWLPWRFKNANVPKGFWDDPNHLIAFFDDFKKHFKYQSLEDFYRAKPSMILELGGNGILVKYGSVWQGIKETYPNHRWNHWRFEDWDLESKTGLDWLGTKLGISRAEDWYRVSYRQIHKWAPLKMFNREKLYSMLTEYYSNHPWNVQKMVLRIGPNKASQRILVVRLKEIFPDLGIFSQRYFSLFKKFKKITSIQIFSSKREERCNWTFSFLPGIWLLNIKESSIIRRFL
jgi:hypothetical protein